MQYKGNIKFCNSIKSIIFDCDTAICNALCLIFWSDQIATDQTSEAKEQSSIFHQLLSLVVLPGLLLIDSENKIKESGWDVSIC